MQKKTYQDLILSEAKTDSIVLAWGRFNPPTTGHEKLINAVVSEAKKRAADYRIYPTKSTDPKKNPLTFKEKVRFMRKMFPRHARKISSDEGINTLIKAVQKLEAEGYKNLTLLAGSDRINEFKTLLNKYNKKDYTFDSINVVSAGERDPDAEDVSGMSASKMRDAASKGNFASFRKGVPVAKIAKPLYDAVRKGMKVNEQFEQDGIFEYVGMLNEEDGGVVGPRFNRLLRFGLATGGTGDIPITKRAFKDFEKSGSSPILRNKIFSTLDRVFDYLLTDEILYHRFLLLLHRKSIFDEGNNMRFHELKHKLDESNQTAALSTADDHPEKMNFVAKFPSPEYTNSFISDIERTGLISVSWKSGDGTEVQFHVSRSTAGQEAPRNSDNAPTKQVDRMNRYSGHDTPQFGSEARVVDLVMKHGGKISRFDGDVREGLEDEPYSNEAESLIEGLLNKAWKTEIAYDILSEVYLRGLDSWEDDCVKKNSTTPDQWAYSRVNSFVSGGKSQKENDTDLWEEHIQREDEPLSEMDEEFIAELGKLGKIAVAGVAYHIFKKRQQKKKDQEAAAKAKPPEENPPETKKPGNWRSQVDWSKNEEYDINESFESEAYDMDERFEMFASEEHGAGDEATSKLRKKYTKDTPGQGCVDEGKTVKFTKGTGDTNDYDFPLKGQTAELVGVDGGNLVAYNKKHGEFTVTDEKYRVIKEGRRVDENIENSYMRGASNRQQANMARKTGPPTKEQMRKRIDREREAAEKKKKKNKVSEDYVEEDAPPSDKAERFIKKNKNTFKDKYGDRSKEVLYATAWKMHNKHWKSKE